jgi:hypothetical protein
MSTPPRRAKRAKLEGEDPVVDLEDFESHRSVRLGDETKTRRSASASPRKAKPIPQSLEKPHPAPARWRETYDTIKDMRRRIVAPVDTMGCDQAQRKETDPKVRIFFFLFFFLSFFLSLLSLFKCFSWLYFNILHFFLCTESQVRDTRVPHAVLANQGRSDRRSCL